MPWELLVLAQAPVPEVVAERWVEFGIAGLVILSLMMGWLVPGKVYDKAVERGDRLEAENRQLRDRIEDKVVPLMHRAIDAIERSSSGVGHNHPEET